MSGLTVIVPSRGRPHAVAQLLHAFDETCMENTRIIFAVDADDPTLPAYSSQILGSQRGSVCVVDEQPASMVTALNAVARQLVEGQDVPDAIGFMGDDHRPRTPCWDRSYLTALRALPGIVYGNDRLQGANLPTQCAISASVVATLGHMAPPVLTHLYVDNYWLDIGRESGCISYLPNVIVEHLHPFASKSEWDEGYLRVNAPESFRRDKAAYQAYMAERGAADVMALRTQRSPGGAP